jgi:hypothetical protein
MVTVSQDKLWLGRIMDDFSERKSSNHGFEAVVYQFKVKSNFFFLSHSLNSVTFMSGKPFLSGQTKRAKKKPGVCSTEPEESLH